MDSGTVRAEETGHRFPLIRRAILGLGHPGYTTGSQTWCRRFEACRARFVELAEALVLSVPSDERCGGCP